MDFVPIFHRNRGNISEDNGIASRTFGLEGWQSVPFHGFFCFLSEVGCLGSALEIGGLFVRMRVLQLSNAVNVDLLRGRPESKWMAVPNNNIWTRVSILEGRAIVDSFTHLRHTLP